MVKYICDACVSEMPYLTASKRQKIVQTSNLSYSMRNASETLIVAHEIA